MGDHNTAVLMILQSGRIGDTYLIGVDGDHCNREVVGLNLELMGRPTDAFDRVADRAGHDLRYAIDASKIMREVGWRPERPGFTAGLPRTIGWYSTHEDWWRQTKSAEAPAT